MRLNLHVHSALSDGVLSPELLAEHLLRQRVQLFSITDHDRLWPGEGELESVRDYLERVPWQKRLPQFAVVVPGVELTTEHLGTEVHVVVYDVQFLILCGERRKIPLYLQNSMPD